MQNKGYIEAITDARLFADFMGSTIEKVEQIVRTAMRSSRESTENISSSRDSFRVRKVVRIDFVPLRSAEGIMLPDMPWST